jgi:hypothetical protein
MTQAMAHFSMLPERAGATISCEPYGPCNDPGHAAQIDPVRPGGAVGERMR